MQKPPQQRRCRAGAVAEGAKSKRCGETVATCHAMPKGRTERQTQTATAARALILDNPLISPTRHRPIIITFRALLSCLPPSLPVPAVAPTDTGIRRIKFKKSSKTKARPPAHKIDPLFAHL